MVLQLLVVPVLAVARQEWIIAVLWLIWVLFSRMVKLSYYLIDNPWRIFHMPAFIIWQYIAAGIKIYAMCTCYNRTWGTRDITVKDGEVIRTKGGAADAAELMKGEMLEDSTVSSSSGNSQDYTDEETASSEVSEQTLSVSMSYTLSQRSQQSGMGRANMPTVGSGHRIPYHLHPSIVRDEFGRGAMAGDDALDSIIMDDFSVSDGPAAPLRPMPRNSSSPPDPR